MRNSTVKKYYSFLKFRRNFTRYSIDKFKSYEIVIFWLKSILTRNQFLILSGMMVGCSAGFAGVILKSLVHYIHYVIQHKVHFEGQILFYLIFPFLGVVLTVIVVKIFFHGLDKKGIPLILYEIAQNASNVLPVKMYSQIVQSAITVGLGGSAGLESPIAVTGAAIGSNFAQTYKLDYRERTLLLAAGATAGIASAFNAPIAGVMFAFEILLTGVVFTDFIPLVVAAVCGSLVSRVLLDEQVLFQFHARGVFNYHNLPYYLILALLCGLYGRYFLVVSQRMEALFHRLNFSRVKKAMIGGAVLSLLCVLFPPLFGEGYDTIKSFTNGEIFQVIDRSFFRYLEYRQWVIIVFVGVICMLKVFATSITIYSGGNGGNFAPSLFAGGSLGFVLALLCTQIGLADVPMTNMIIVGMAGVMSGVMYAPLTAIFLIAESSSGYDLFIPLMIVSTISFLIAKWFSPISPDLKALAENGQIFTREYDRNLLSLLHTMDLLDKETQIVDYQASGEELAEVIRNGKRNLIAVLDQNRNLKGVINLNDIRPTLFNENKNESLLIASLMKEPKTVVGENDSVVTVAKKFDQTGLWNLPVIRKTGEFAGFVSKSTVLDCYRRLLQEHSG
ncbi:chloride channel protein [Dyadobacter frigoris]|uniref:Chloride channel protein n=1 Tax=Dyadobacter frigoris TaxID=2576211 RepID=A0A4U6CNK6_9BACT|nr:chloride channel protein [Dyadobacter frigoris]TKT85969.1 chloride channel protein [Dyadobacter frigoris]GLU57429.1 transporter [Dyadobacter frigoris]